MKYRDRYVFYKDRPEWSDVQPVPQDEGERNVVRIAYSPQFTDAHDYMRAVLLKDERSERALEITSTVLFLNPANYTVWEYRRRILISLQVDLWEELQFTGKLIDEHAKNYQLWHHRQWIVTQLAEQSDQRSELKDKHQYRHSLGQGELDFTATVVSDDTKNYHAWQYRRWVVNHFHIPPAGELEYTDKLIQEDMYNNSAWNHRFVTVTKDEGLSPPVLQREVEYVQKIIRAAPNNESSWNYLYGLLVPSPCMVTASTLQTNARPSSRPDLVGFNTSAELIDETARSASPLERKSETKPLTKLIIRPPSTANLRAMRKFAEDLAASDSVAANSVALLGFLVEVYTDCIQDRVVHKTQDDLLQSGLDTCAGESRTSTKDLQPDRFTSHNDGDESLSDLTDLAISTCERLATEADRIRANYWRYRSRQIQTMFA